MKYLINLTYNGNNFFGYQIQNNKRTVEGELEKCIINLIQKQ